MSDVIEFIISIDRKWFDAIVSGLKTVEGKCLKSEKSTASRILKVWSARGSGQIILIFKCDDDEVRKCLTDLTLHASISDMLKHHGLENALPGARTFEEGLATYAKYYSPELEATGVIGLVLGNIH
jgi:ASC-1-like (ASCH) protein